jgi:hypothetical protein
VEEANAFIVTMIRAFFTDLKVVNLFVNGWTSWELIVTVRRP